MAQGNMKILREGNFKIIPRLVCTDKYRYTVRVYEYEAREKNGIGQKGNNTGQGRLDPC